MPCLVNSWFNLLPIGWEAISAVVLIVTAILIWLQTKATKELVENDTRPVVEAGFIHHRDQGTYLQFLNKKPEIPALVWVVIQIRIDEHEIEADLEPKLKGEEPWRILHHSYSTNYLLSFRNLLQSYGDKQIEMSVELSVAPLFLPKRKSLFYRKFYRFENSQWVDTHWGIADIPFNPKF